MGASTKCNWKPNRCNRPRNGWRSIASSGRDRSIVWPSIWKKQTKPRKEINNHVSRLLRQSRFDRNWRDFERGVDDARAREISYRKETKRRSEELKMKLMEMKERETMKTP